MRSEQVDIVLASNRTSPYLDEALDGIASQTHENWRLIAVDDGCDDADAFKQRILRLPNAVVVSNDGSGLPAARNTGISHGSSELIAFHDDDDVWHAEKLTRQVAAMRSRSNAGGCHTAGWYMDARSQQFGDGWSAQASPSRDLLRGSIPLPRIVTLMVRRDACRDAGGFDPTYSLAEDLDFIMRLAEVAELIAIDEPLVGYRRHGSNMSQAASIEGRRASRRLLLSRLDHPLRPQHRELFAQNLRAARVVWADEVVTNIIGAARARDMKTVRQEAMWGLRYTPVNVIKSLAKRLIY